MILRSRRKRLIQKMEYDMSKCAERMRVIAELKENSGINRCCLVYQVHKIAREVQHPVETITLLAHDVLQANTTLLTTTGAILTQNILYRQPATQMYIECFVSLLFNRRYDQEINFRSRMFSRMFSTYKLFIRYSRIL